jgi:hypothetical protein
MAKSMGKPMMAGKKAPMMKKAMAMKMAMKKPKGKMK